MIKILFFINSLRAGGKERQLVELLKGLKKTKEFQAEVITMAKEIHYKEIYDLENKIHYLIRKIKKDPSIFLKLFRICQDFKPDIIHTWDTMTSIFATPIAKMLKIKLLNGSIRVAPNRIKLFSNRWFLNLITFPFADVILANSYAGLYSYRVSSKKGVCIHNGFDINRIKNLREKDYIRKKLNINTQYVVGMVGNVTRNKDYHTYVKAAQSIIKLKKDVTFLIIGDFQKNKERKNIHNNLISIIKQSNMNKIKFLGRQENVESIINIFDIGILMSNNKVHGEGISNSITEYMILKKPVIASNGGGTPELIIDNITGYLIEPDDSNALASKILFLINHPKVAKEMGKRGKERILTEFNLEKMINNYEKLFYEMIDKK